MENDITDIGKVAITPQKDYKENATYEWLDVVTYDGASYMCISEDGCTGIIPTNTEYWQLLADKGRFTEEDKETFKQAVVEESKTTINEHTETKKTEIDNYTTNLETSLKNELDTYEEGKEEELDIHKTTLETEMTNTKDSLVEEIETAKNGFDENVTAKITEFNNNATEQTNTFNSNAETKTADFNTNASTKQTEYDDNATSKLEEYNNNSTTKLAEFNENAESYEKRIAELETERDEIAEQMPWNTTDISESIHIEDSAKYSRNKLLPFGNMKQETREGYNLLKTENFIFTNGTLEQNGLTATIKSDGSIVINGTATGVTYLKNNIKNIIEDGNYYFYNFNNVTQSNTTYYMLVQGNKSTGYESADYYNARGYQTDNFVKDTTVYDRTFNCMFVFTNGFVANNLILYPVISKSVQTAYEQYGAMPSIEYPSMPVVATGVQTIKKIKKNFFTGLKTGHLTNEGQILEKDNFVTSDFIKLNPNTTYTMSNLIVSTAGNGYKHIIEYDVNKQFVKRNFIGNGSEAKYTFTTSNTTKYIAYGIFSSFSTSEDASEYINNNNIQLEKGNTATDYEPYKEEVFELDLGTTELCKITDTNGNVVAQDKFVFKDGKWQINKIYGKRIFNENSKWGIEATNNFFVNEIIKDSKEVTHNELISNIFPKNYTVNERMLISNNKKFNIITNKIEHTVEAIKEYCKTTNIVLYYPLNTPTYEDCTPAQSAVLDKLHKLQLQQGTNNIFVESENGVTTELQLEYMQNNNLKKEQENKALEDRITAIENLLSTTQTSALLLDNMQTDLESEVK